MMDPSLLAAGARRDDPLSRVVRADGEIELMSDAGPSIGA